MFNHMNKTLTEYQVGVQHVQTAGGQTDDDHDSGVVLLKLMKILAGIPACSCSTEHSFSSLRRMKTYLRNTMSQDHLANLAVMTIEPGYVNRV